MKKDLGLEAELRVGSSGIYEVAVDGKVVVAKSLIHGFPTDQDVVAAVKQALGR